MLHVSYGLFDDVNRAQAAIERIEVTGAGRRCHAVLQASRLDEGRLGIAETGAAEVATRSAAAGALIGAVSGALIVGPIGLMPGAAVGAAYGGFAGALAGAGAPERALSRLSKHLAEGKVLVVVEAPSLACRDRADDLMRENGAYVEHKPLV